MSVVILLFCCIVLMSMYYRLCLVMVHMKVLQSGRLVRFFEEQLVGAHLAGASVTKMATLLDVSRAAVSKVVMAYTNHGRTSAKRNSGCKTKTK